MTNKEIAKEAFELASKEARQKQVETVKKVVQKTLEKLEDVKKQISDLKETERLLKLDLDDLKSGKLELMAERQEKDEKAKKTSVVVIIKEQVVHDYSPWYWPFRVVWPTPSWNYSTPMCNGGTNLSLTNGVSYASDFVSTGTSDALFITSSVAKDAAIGHYDVGLRSIDLR